MQPVANWDRQVAPTLGGEELCRSSLTAADSVNCLEQAEGSTMWCTRCEERARFDGFAASSCVIISLAVLVRQGCDPANPTTMPRKPFLGARLGRWQPRMLRSNLVEGLTRSYRVLKDWGRRDCLNPSWWTVGIPSFGAVS